jgi:hypothetical protein
MAYSDLLCHHATIQDSPRALSGNSVAQQLRSLHGHHYDDVTFYDRIVRNKFRRNLSTVRRFGDIQHCNTHITGTMRPLNDWLIARSEQERMWKEAVRILCDIWLQRLKKTMNEQDSVLVELRTCHLPITIQKRCISHHPCTLARSV